MSTCRALGRLLDLDTAERMAFVQAARAKRAVDRLALPAQPVEQPVVALPQRTITFLFSDIVGSTRRRSVPKGKEPEAATIKKADFPPKVAP